MTTVSSLTDGQYNARDVLSMCRIYPVLCDAVAQTQTVDVYATDLAMAHLALQMTRAGMPVDDAERKRVGDHLRKLRDEAAVLLVKYTDPPYRDTFVEWASKFYAVKARKGEPFAGKVREEDGLVYSHELAFEARAAIRKAEFLADIAKDGVNYGAKVVQAAILRAAGVPLLQLTPKSGLPKIDKEILESFGYHEAARAMLTYTLTAAALRTFVDGLELGVDGRLHPEWTVHKITGRWGSSPNCFDSKTELLVRGPCGVDWLRIDRFLDMWATHQVAQYVPETGAVSWTYATDVLKRYHDGTMIRLSHDLLDLVVTPEHRTFACTGEKGRADGSHCADDLFRQVSMDGVRDPPAESVPRLVGTADALKFVAFRGGKPSYSPCIVPFEDVEYTEMRWAGMVYCLSVPSSYVVVRRNGKCCVAGQCQNWSKRAGGGAENLRRMIVAPEGFIFVGADQKQLEARLIGAMSQDPFLLGVFARGEDIHGALAGVAFPNWPMLAETYAAHKAAHARIKTTGIGCGKTPEQPYCEACAQRDKVRDLTKRLEYGVFYGGAPDTLWKSVVKEFPDIKLDLILQFMRNVGLRMPDVLAWRTRTLAKVLEDGEIRSPLLGRREVFPMSRVDPTVVYNFLPQSGGADLWALGAIVFCERWPQDGDDVRIIHNGHDSVLILCRKELADRVVKDVHECWEREWNGVQFLMDCKTGKYWSEV